MAAPVCGPAPPPPHGTASAAPAQPHRPPFLLSSREPTRPQSILRNREQRQPAQRRHSHQLGGASASGRTVLALTGADIDQQDVGVSARPESVSFDSAASSRERASDSVVFSAVAVSESVALPPVTLAGSVAPPAGGAAGTVWRPLDGARNVLRRGRHWWRGMSAKIADWAVTQDLRGQRDVEAASVRRARSLHRQLRDGKASTRSMRSIRSQGDILRDDATEAPTADAKGTAVRDEAADPVTTSDRSRRTSSRLSIHDINRLNIPASECRSLSAGRSVPDLATHDVSRRAIHLPQPQFELHGAVTLTPHVTLSRPSTPGPAGPQLEGPGSPGRHSRQPSLHRHRASAQLEELRSQPGSTGDTDGSGAASSFGAGTLSTLRTSWTSVTVPFGGTRRWKIRPQVRAQSSCEVHMIQARNQGVGAGAGAHPLFATQSFQF